jgi:cellulose synthase/poly-beta-1,6-N-acetylglucosamine synthase-like glycosyltransferase/glycosyltransferase involved in cell wall biosynthesis
MSQRETRIPYESSEAGAASYDAEYYRTGCGPKPYEHNEYWLRFFGAVADALIEYLKPQTAFDAGCALGFLVETLRDRGVQAWGADISEFAIQNVRQDIRPYCRVASITQPIAADTQTGRYDLLACIEVLEHLTPEEVGRALANMTAVTDTILFSSSPYDFKEPTHINVRPPIDWLQLFAAQGFSPDLAFNATLVSPHAMLLRRDRQPMPQDVQVFYNDAILLNSAITVRDPDVPAPARVPAGHILSGAFGKAVEMMRIGDQLAEFVQKNTEMARLIDGISVVNQDMLKRNAELERRNEELAKQVAGLLRPGDTPAADNLNAPPTDEELALMRKLFDRSYYVGENVDVRVSSMDPLDHFQEFGAWEGRSPHPLFDNSFYLSQHPEVVESRVNPLLHYLRAGVLSKSNPHPLFDTAFYLHEYTDVADCGMNPLIHFIEHGAAEGRNPHPFFSTKDYLAANPDVAATARNALIHYVLSGAAEGRPLRIPMARIDPTPYVVRISKIEPDAEELRLQGSVSRQFLLQPVISVVVPVYRVDFAVLKAMVESAREQTYTHWELCLAHGYPEDQEGRAWLQELAKEDPRIKVDLLDENLGISGNSNRALALATGDFVGLLDHDDTLAPFALYEVVKLINDKPDVDFLYSDKDCVNEQGERISPLFKPRWSPDLMLSANYLTHFCVIRMEHMRAVGGWRPETDGAQDWDLFFRVVERSQRIELIDKVLYHWGIVATSVAHGGVQAKPYALRSQMQTIAERLARLGAKGKPSLQSNGAMRIRWELPHDKRISVIFISGHPGDRMLEQARELRDSINHPSVEIVFASPDVTDHRERSGKADIVTVATPPGATLASKLNAAVAASRGQYLVFWDDCVYFKDADWLTELVGPLQLDNVAIVSPQLMDPRTGTVRHAGIVFNRDGDLGYIFAGESEHAYGVFGGPSWCRNWSAVSGACFAMRREVFDEVGGFAENPRYPRLDIDLCLRVTVMHGWRIFYNSYAQFDQVALTRLEQWIKNAPDAAREYARLCFPQGDPFFHPRLKCRDGKVLLEFGEDAASPRNDYAAEARALTSWFDFAPALLKVSRNAMLNASPKPRLKHAMWFLPDFTHPFYGGIHTILRAADYFQRAHQVRSTFVTPCPEVVIRRTIAAAFPALADESAMVEFTGSSQVASLEACDAAIATLWTTAYSVLNLRNARRKFYFMQDYESRFYPAGSISALVEATYHFGFNAICNTISLRDIYTQLGGKGEYFNPSIDPSIFHAKTRTPQPPGEPLTLFCYARPTHPRNGFELLSQALKIVKKRLGEDVLIVTAGADWSPRQFGLGGIVHNLGLLPYSATGALYRSCTAGVALMMTCHPSYLPFELMASGALVITNSNPYNSWLLKDRENCLLAETSPTALAEALEEGLRNHKLREELVKNAARLIEEKYSDWDAQMEKIYRYVAEDR